MEKDFTNWFQNKKKIDVEDKDCKKYYSPKTILPPPCGGGEAEAICTCSLYLSDYLVKLYPWK